MTQHITAQLLNSKGACREQVEIFIKAWPQGGPVTIENCLSAIRLGLDLDWSARKLLSAPAWTAYEEATATAWTAYLEAKATAFCEAWIIDHPIREERGSEVTV